jgi:hypothetical protein
MKRWMLMFALIFGGALLFAACALPAIQPVPAAIPAAEDTAEPDTATEATPLAAVPQQTVEVIEDGAAPSFSTFEWTTDFSRRTVEWDELISGGPPKDGIPAIDDPSFESIEAASSWLTERDPVIVFAHEGVARAYPGD